MNTHPSAWPIDSSAILYLAQMGLDHTNVYRFSVVLTEPVSPEHLQQAADRICPRFPTIVAGFRPKPFTYAVVPAPQPPQVRQDPGLLHTMLPEEIASCAYRIYYHENQIIMEAFHALTDGFGAVASLRALLGEYVYLRYGIRTPEWEGMLQTPPDWDTELRDAYLDYCGTKTGFLPTRYAYQIPGQDQTSQVHGALCQVSTGALREAARRSGVSVTSLVAGLFAESIMEIQNRHGTGKKPVRIMVPIDLRRQFPSGTFRNFILYALPTLLPEEAQLPRAQRLERFHRQILAQTDRDFMAAQITRNVKLQKNPLFRCLPRAWKCALMRLSYRFFGESNSSITLTNLGPVGLSEAMREYVRWIEVYLTPRRNSPYNCALLSCGDVTSISITRFGIARELDELVFSKLRQVLKEKE